MITVQVEGSDRNICIFFGLFVRFMEHNWNSSHCLYVITSKSSSATFQIQLVSPSFSVMKYNKTQTRLHTGPDHIRPTVQQLHLSQN